MSPMRVCNDTIVQNLFVDIVLGKDFFDTMLDQYGKEGWNTYCTRLECHDVNMPIPRQMPSGDVCHGCMPVCVTICMDGEDFSNRDLKDLDLRMVSMRYCNFNRAHLGASLMGWVEGSSFKHSNLKYARFNQADISGCNFGEARIMYCDFERASYMEEDPPLHLPKPYLNKCSKFPRDWKQYPNPGAFTPDNHLAISSVELKCAWGSNE